MKGTTKIQIFHRLKFIAARGKIIRLCTLLTGSNNLYNYWKMIISDPLNQI